MKIPFTATVFAAAIGAFALIAEGCRSQPSAPAPAEQPMKLSAGQTAQANSFVYVTGIDGGTVTVPQGQYITSIWVAGAGTITITPLNPYTNPACYDAGQTCTGDAIAPDGAAQDAGCTFNDAGPCTVVSTQVITVPASGWYSLAVPVLQNSSYGLADGTIVTFSVGTDFAVTLNWYGPH